MKNVRSLHLYLGCVFAPLLFFFTVSGIWQTLGIRSPWLRRLSTIHTSHLLKSGDGLTNQCLKGFVVLMALSFLLSTVLGVMLALKYGRNRRLVAGCLIFGVLFPVALILIGRWL